MRLNTTKANENAAIEAYPDSGGTVVILPYEDDNKCNRLIAYSKQVFVNKPDEPKESQWDWVHKAYR